MKKLMLEIALALKPKSRGIWSYLKGSNAYEKGDYASALNEWHPLAAQGDARAQVAVGIMYATGAGVTKNETEAERWYRLAAKQGNAVAQYELGKMYDQGYNYGYSERRNNFEAERWYRLAAEQGNAAAQYELGEMYSTGCDTGGESVLDRDQSEAMRWYRLAAKQGNALAQYELGTFFDYNKRNIDDVVDANPNEAMRWYRSAAKQGNADAQCAIGVMYKTGTNIRGAINNGLDDAEAVRWFRLAAMQGHGTAQFHLGHMYSEGDGLVKDIVLAHMWHDISIRNDGSWYGDGARDELEKTMTRDQIDEAKRRAQVCVASNYRDCE